MNNVSDVDDDIDNDVDGGDDEPGSPKRKKPRVDKGKKVTKPGLFGSGMFSMYQNMFTPGQTVISGNGFTGPLIHVESKSGFNASVGYGNSKVGEQVMTDMHAYGVMGMQRSMKEAAYVAQYNKIAVVKHAFHPSSISMMIQSLVYMIKERMKMLNQQIDLDDVTKQISLGLMVDLNAALELMASGLTWCKPEKVGMVIARAVMLDQHDKAKTNGISKLITEAGMLAAIQQSQAGSNTVYGGYKGIKRNKKRKSVCFKFRDTGSCPWGNECRFAHVPDNGGNKDEKK